MSTNETAALQALIERVEDLSDAAGDMLEAVREREAEWGGGGSGAEDVASLERRVTELSEENNAAHAALLAAMREEMRGAIREEIKELMESEGQDNEGQGDEDPDAGFTTYFDPELKPIGADAWPLPIELDNQYEFIPVTVPVDGCYEMITENAEADSMRGGVVAEKRHDSDLFPRAWRCGRVCGRSALPAPPACSARWFG